jgi:hypothetical protein
VAAGLTETEAQRAAIAAFGPVRAIVYAHQTRHGRVWSVPLGGYFPLTTVIVSAGVAVGALVLNNIHVVTGQLGVGLAVIGLLAVGLVVTYGGRMWQMLRQQARGRGELA